MRNIDYTNITKVIDRIFIRWGVQDNDKLQVLNISSEEYENLSKNQNQPCPDIKERLAYILNIHEQLAHLHSNRENWGIFVTTPNNAEVFNKMSPLEYMKTNGVKGIKSTYEYLKDANKWI